MRRESRKKVLTGLEPGSADLSIDPSQESDVLLTAYKAELERIAAELEYKVMHDSTLDQTMKYLDEELGKKLPSSLAVTMNAELIRNWLEASYIKTSVGVIQGINTATHRLPESVKWFESANSYDYGNIYNSFRNDMQTAIKDAFEGKDSISQSIRERAARTVDRFGDAMGSSLAENRYRLVTENAVVKARNFSQILSMDEIGITEYQISAIMDQKTSNICRTLNGKVFQVKEAVKYVNDVFNTAPDKVTSKFPWADQKDFPQTDAERNALKPSDLKSLYDSMPVKLPPYHAKCRTSVIVKSS